MDKKTSKIWSQCFKHRFTLEETKDWTVERDFGVGGISVRIAELLRQGKKVKGGYFCNDIHGFHFPSIIWK